MEDHGGGFLMSYLVTSPLVLVKVPDQAGDGYRVDYHYQGSVVPWLSKEQAKHFVGEGLVVEVGSKPADDGEADDGEVERPAKVANKPVLVGWLVDNAAHDDGSDFTVDELEPKTKDELWELIDAVS